MALRNTFEGFGLRFHVAMRGGDAQRASVKGRHFSP